MSFKNETKQEVRNLIATDNVEKAIRILLKNTNNDSILREVILINARLQSVEKSKIKGVIKTTEITYEMNKIRDDLLKLLDTPTINVTRTSKIPTSIKKKKKFKDLLIIIGLATFTIVGIMVSSAFAEAISKTYKNPILPIFPYFTFLVIFLTVIFHLPHNED